MRDNNIDLIVFDEETPGKCGTSAGPEPLSITAAVSCAHGKRPYEPPVIETVYPSRTGLPPGVFEEWGGECIHPSEIDHKERHKLQSVQSYPRVTRWLKTWRTWVRRLGLRRPKPSGIVYRVHVKDRKNYGDE